MSYWIHYRDTIRDADVLGWLDEWIATRKELVGAEKAFFVDEAQRALLDGFKDDWHAVVDEAQAMKLNELADNTVEFLGDRADFVEKMYMGEDGVFDRASDPQVWVFVALKLLRVLIAWVALRIASKVFQQSYDSRVYNNEQSPPSPLKFVGLFVALDLAMNAGVAVLLVFCRYLFKSVDNDFPIDGPFLTSWAVDYAATTVVIAALAAIVGAVVAKKKYFRWKYEGDRGVRALQQMTFYIYLVILAIPFYNLTIG
jgi:hypothetical protein